MSAAPAGRQVSISTWGKRVNRNRSSAGVSASTTTRRLVKSTALVLALALVGCSGAAEDPSAEGAVSGGPGPTRAVATDAYGGYYRYAGDILLDRSDPSHQRLIEILAPEASDPSSQSASQVGIPLWPAGQVRYHFNANASPEDRAAIRGAMSTIEAVTNVRFLEQGSAGLFVYEISRITNPEIGGESTLGFTARPFFNYTTTHAGVVTHELLHGLGFFHEHQRYDRDSFVTINWASIMPAYTSQFAKQPWNLYVPYTTYDYRSIMHYPATAFSANGAPTIDAHGEPIGQRTALSNGDIEGLRARYGYLSSGPTAIAFLHGSVNQDRRMDLVQLWNASGRVGMITYLSNGATFDMGWGSADLGQGSGALAWMAGDVNGDGRTDVIQAWNNGGRAGLITYLSDGVRYFNNWGTGSLGPGAGALAWLTGDVNGDGRTDVIQPWSNGGRLGMITYLSDGAGYSYTWGTSDMGQGASALAWLTGDVNGDGRTDIIQPWDNGGRLGIVTHLSNGYGYYNNWATGDMGQGSGALAWLTGDVDGDGRTDLVQVWSNGTPTISGQPKLGVILYASDGNSFSTAWGTGDIGMPAVATSWHLSDVDGDGRADLTMTFDANGTLGVKTFFSTGRGFRNL